MTPRSAIIAGIAAVAFAFPAVAQQPAAVTHVELWQPGGKQPFKSFKPIRPARSTQEAACSPMSHHRPAGKLPHHAVPAAPADCAPDTGTATAS